MAEVASRVQKHRISLRKRGLRPLQIWVPDTRQKGFAEECRRQSALIRKKPEEQEILQFLEEVADRSGWTA